MYRITNTESGENFEYAYIDDFLSDVIGDEDVQDWLDDMFEPIEICNERFGAGFVLRKCLDVNRWTDFVDEFIRSEVEYIEDEIASAATCDWREYFIEDLDMISEDTIEEG